MDNFLYMGVVKGARPPYVNSGGSTRKEHAKTLQQQVAKSFANSEAT